MIFSVDTKACKVDDLVHNETISIFGFGVEDGFKNVEYPFNWNGNYSYTLENVSSVCSFFEDTSILYNKAKLEGLYNKAKLEGLCGGCKCHNNRLQSKCGQILHTQFHPSL